LKVNERRDDTTKPGAESRPARAPRSYYYDDATGYEAYEPEEVGEEEEPAGERDDTEGERDDEEGARSRRDG
jgi:hypothetical protein